jgi:hypothetical protein
MSTDYSFGVGAGFELAFRQIVKKYGRKLPEKSHTEDRYDSKTGKKLAPEKVVDRPAGTMVVIDGQEIDPAEDPWKVAEALEKVLRADILLVNDNPNGVDEGDILLVRPESVGLDDVSTECLDYGRVTADGGYSLEQLAAELPKFKELGIRLKKLGFKVGKPMVRVVGGYG